jgi:hypothetical protein
LHVENKKIAFLGPLGTYTHEASSALLPVFVISI